MYMSPLDLFVNKAMEIFLEGTSDMYMSPLDLLVTKVTEIFPEGSSYLHASPFGPLCHQGYPNLS